MTDPKKLLIFGASGAVGRIMVQAALVRGHHVTGFFRTPGKLSISHPRLDVVEGNVGDKDAVDNVIKGHDAVLSCLGVGTPLKRDPVVVTGVAHMISAMEKSGPARLIYLSFLGVGDTRRQLGPLLGGIIVPLLLREEVADHSSKESLVVASRLDWIIVRPPKLTAGSPSGRYRHGSGLKRSSLFPTLLRGDVAAFMLDQVDQPTYVRRVVEMLR